MEEINLNGKSLDILKENVTKLKQLFPEVVTEDNIDFDKLKAVLGEYIEKDDESYRFTWYGKRDAFRKSQIPSTGTIRPCIEESKDWDTTQNLYIEGDNLEVLKLLQKSYNNRIKMIYIDPPYNKDKDFIYSDKWSDPIKEYKKITGQIDDDGNVTSSDTEDEGGKHTKWLNMMYPRLRLARTLLSEDGVIFISIDDDEVANLKKLCNEVFGEENFLACIVWERAYSPVNLKKHFSESHDFILCYAKSINNCVCNGLKRSDDANDRYKNPDNDPRGPWKSTDLSVGPAIQEKRYEIITPSGRKVLPPEGRCWVYTEERYKEMLNDNRIWFGESGNNVPSVKKFLSEVKNTITPMTIWKYTEVGHSQDAAKNLIQLFDGKSYFDYPKSIDLIKRMIELYTDTDSIILDFFSGSATTAHAVMQINAQDEGSRKYIMVQIPETIDEKTDAYKSGLINISEIGKERIRRAGEKIKAELVKKYEEYKQKQQSMVEEDEQAPINPDDLDIGFKVFKLDNSNLKKWSVDVGEDFYKESKEVQNAILTELLFSEVDNFVDGRSELDVVYEIMLKYGLDLTYPIETYDFNGTNIYSIGYGGLIVCLDKNLKAELADKIVELIRELEPSMVRVAVRDLSFGSDSVKTNFKETLKNGVYAYFDSSDDKADKQNQFKFITI